MILLNNDYVERDEVKVDIEDRGYQFGDGVYEVIRVYNGKTFMMSEHLRRLRRSLTAVQIKPPYEMEQLRSNILSLIEKDALENGIVYLQITRGEAVRNHAFPKNASSVLAAYTKEMARPYKALNEGIHAHLVEDMRWLLCDIKSLNLLGNIMAKQEAIDNECQEAVLHRGETVTEGSSSNVFIVKGNQLQTHPASNMILNGITRLLVIDIASEIGLPIIEKPFTVQELLSAGEVFVASTTQEVSPVINISGNIIGKGNPGHWTTKIQSKFEKRI